MQKTVPPKKPQDWSDTYLLHEVLKNDNRAWSEFVRRYRNLIYRCVSKVTGKFAAVLTNADIDEIYAEVLMALFRDDMKKLRRYDPQKGTKLASWIGMISINASYDFLRGTSRRPILDRIDGVGGEREETKRTPLDVVMEKERWSHLNEMLTDFSDKDRRFLELYYARGVDAAVIAEEMSISLKTVYSKKHKIRAHLREYLSKTTPENNAISDLA